MSNYQSLLQQKAELESRIAEVLKHEKAQAVTRARELVKQYGLNVDNVFGKYTSSGFRTSVAQRATAAPRYRDPETGATWTGRGRAPA